MADPKKYISKLNVNNVEYEIKDAEARAAIAGGVHFRGILTENSDPIADGDALKKLIVKDGEGTKEILAADQHDGDMFIYNAGTAEKPKNLEFLVANGKYSELGSTGVLGALAFKNDATGSTTVPLSSNIKANAYTPLVDKGTLAVSATTAAIATTATAADFDFESAPGTLLTTTATATISSKATAASVTTTNTAASITHTATSVTAAGPTVSLTYTTGRFTALQDVTYDANSETLSISNGTSDAFTKVPSVDTVGNVTVTYDKTTAVTYAKTTAVTYDKAETSITYVKTTGVTYDRVSIVTYDKASGTFVSGATLTGNLAVTAAAPTLTITNPEITVTVS